ncbi:hypothetical protein HY994_06435 [Candidatus Micrarchaeota archaeon]|nr:hypothetical protein [Candidatus Micrarchaeota archaeon]
MVLLRRSEAPFPEHFDSLADELLKHYSILLNNVSPQRARQKVATRIRQLETQYYAHRVLNELVSKPEHQLSLIQGRNPLRVAMPKRNIHTITLKEALEASGVGLAAAHAFGLPDMAFYFSATAGMYPPVDAAIRNTLENRTLKRRVPLANRVDGLILHSRTGAKPLSAQQKAKNFDHVRKCAGDIQREYNRLHVTLRMLDALHEVLRQTPETAVQNVTGTRKIMQQWKKRAFQYGRGLMDRLQPVQEENIEEKAEITPLSTERMYQRWQYETRNLLDSPPEKGKESEWLLTQKRLLQDRSDFEKALEIQFDLNEWERVLSALRKNETPDGLRLEDMQKRDVQMRKKYGKLSTARKNLERFLAERPGEKEIEVHKIQK